MINEGAKIVFLMHSSGALKIELPQLFYKATSFELAYEARGH